MKLKAVKRAVLAALGENWDVLDCTDSFQITHITHSGRVDVARCGITNLVRLSDILQTDRIDVQYTKETPGWSDWTPGDPADFRIVVKK